MTTTVDINIIQVAGTKVCIVDQVSLNPGDKVRWVNQTNDAASVFFPHTFGLGASVFCHTISANSDYRHQAVAGKKNPGGPPESFRYAVYCNASAHSPWGARTPRSS